MRRLISGPLAICGFLGILYVYVTPLAGQSTKIQRDWSKNPAVIQVDAEQDLYVVGDPHADYNRLVAVLTGSKILNGPPTDPSKAGWNAGKAVVVFTGDLVDKWKHSLKVIALVRSLQSAAADAGGQVIIMTGNHEAEFLAAPGSKKVKEFAGELKSAGLDPADVAACKGNLGQFLCALPFAARVNDGFFSHAGNTAGRSMSKLISDLQNGVDQDGFATQQLIGGDSLLEARLGDTPWFQPNGADAQKTLAAYASALGVKHIVQGHQPGNVTFADGIKRKKGEMFQRYGLIFLEDTGMSRGVEDSHGAVLRIPAGNRGEAIAICDDGTATTIWDSGSHADIGKIAPCGGK